MRTVRYQLTVGVVAAVALAGISTPATATPGTDAAEPVSLVVGLRTDIDRGASVDRLENRADVDVVDGAPATDTGALTVEVDAQDVDKATAALTRDPAVTYVEPDYTASVDTVTVDPYRSAQWAVDVAGVSSAWRRTTGSADVTVAVVDTGVSPVSDLTGALLPGYNAIDDSTDVTDDHGHGTQAAAVVAAQGNNGIAAAGVCWNCKILPVKVLGANGAGAYSDIAEGIRWAADQDADIINLSLGGEEDGQVLREAVSYAVAQGSLVVAAAGNDGENVWNYPAAITDVLAVGASDRYNNRYTWSNYGTGWVDIAAPGCNQAQTFTGTIDPTLPFCGTSSATPFLAGVAGLALSVRPGATAAQIRTVLTGTATALAGDAWVASGRVNAAAAVDTLAPVVSVLTPAVNGLVRGTVTAGVNATDDTSVQRVELIAGGRIVGTDRVAPWAPTWASGTVTGRTTVTVRAYDIAGRSTTATRAVTVDNTAPTLTVTSAPANGTRRIRGIVRVAASATDTYGVQRVELLVNGVKRTTDTLAPYSFAVDTAKYGSTIKVQLRAYDRAGNVRLSPLRTWYRS